MMIVKNIYWERVNLHILFDNDLGDKKIYLVNSDTKNRILVTSCSNEIVINISNFPEGQMFDAGKWNIYIDDKLIKIDENIICKLDDYSRVFKYRNGFYAYIVNFEIDEELNFLIVVSYMMKNKKYKKFYQLHEGEKLKDKIKIFIKKVLIVILNIVYRFFRLFKFKKNRICFYSDNDKLSDNLEFTFECNLNDINEELLNFLKDNRVNRLSIGIESFNEDKLAFMERSHTYEEAENAISLARSIGFDNINIDLMYGIPGESLKDLKKDIELFLKLDPDHISTYSLIVEDNTKISNAGVVPISEELDASMYELICDKLDNKKYVHYEVSNFAKRGKESRHNLTYWNNEEYYGFGLGASGYRHGVRYENTRSITKYFKGEYVKNEELLSKEDKMYNELMLGFRKMEGINLREFFLKYEINMQEAFDLREVLKEKELLVDGEYIYVNPEYIYVMNEILIKII